MPSLKYESAFSASRIAVAGETETCRGNPPSSAVPMLPGVWTDRVGLPLVLLCLEMKTIRSGLMKLSVRVCAFTASSLRMSSVTFFLFIWAWYTGFFWKLVPVTLKG